MKPFKSLVCFLTLVVICFSVPKDSKAEEQKLYQLIERGKTEIYHFRLAEAIIIFRQIQNEFSELPHGYFYEAFITAIHYSQDRTNVGLDSVLQRTIRVAIAKGESYRKQGNQPAEAAYYLGVSHGVLGIYHVLNSSYLKGYLHGRRAKNYLEEAVTIDSAYYDAYLGLGIFHYYTDLLPGVIKFFASILGFSGDRAQGIREIEKTALQGQYLKIEAEFTHGVIRYFLEGAYSGSLQTFLRLNRLYPENPALLLLIGYHYRRFGQIEKAERYFNSVSDGYREKLPQIIVMKYYNLGVCYYRLNDFEEAEKCFNRLMDKNLRKSPYYQAAIAFYKGILAGLKHDQVSADYYFGLIRYNQETQYWYYISRIYSKSPFDEIMRDYIIAENHAYTFKTAQALTETEALLKTVDENRYSVANPDLVFLIKDLEARLAYQQGQVLKSRQLFESFLTDLQKYDDDFQKAWIYISYARVLRELKDWEEALKALKKAEVTNDEYTRLIIEREKYILKKSQLNLRS